MRQCFVLATLALLLVSSQAKAWDIVWPNSFSTSSLTAVWGSSGSDVFAVGVGGTILHYDGSAWSVMNSGTGKSLYGVWSSSGSDVFAVGYDGTILHYDGVSWSAMSPGMFWLLKGVWGSPGGDVFSVGVVGNIVHYDGAAWSNFTTGTDEQFTGVWGSSGDDVFAVGIRYPQGSIWRYNGTTWSDTAFGSPSLWGVWGSAANDVFAVGSSCTILHYNGTAWSAMNSGTSQQLYSVWGRSSRDIFVVGAWEAILHHDGTTKIDALPAASQPGGATITFIQTVADERTDAYLHDTFATPSGFTPFTSVREFTATTNAPGGKAVFSCQVKGLTGTVGGLVLAKLRYDGTSRAFTFSASGGASSTSGTWWILDSAGSPMAGAQTLDPATIYEVRFIIRDNDSRFDLDAALGTIRDPFVIGTGGDWSTDTGDSGGSGGSGGGGCYFNPSARFGLEWLLLLALTVLARLRRLGRRAH